MSKKKSPDRHNKNSAAAASFLSEMTAAAMVNGEFETARARDYLRAETKKRREQVAALNAQLEVLAAMDKAFEGWQAVSDPIILPDRQQPQKLTPKYTFDDDQDDENNQSTPL